MSSPTDQPTFIRQPLSNRYIATAIDSGGMTVYWTDLQYADDFGNKEHAQDFITRLKERYPKDEFEIVTPKWGAPHEFR